MSELFIRKGGAHDTDTLLEMFDGAVAWLAARGSAGQWGTDPWSRVPHRAQRVRDMAANDGLRIAEIDGVPAGAVLLVEECPPYVPAAGEPELYIGLLVISREYAGRRVGARLIRLALEEASQRGISLVRLDCWAGGNGDLVRYYQRQGFKPTEQFDLDGWIGQVFEQWVG
jgi:GNAT superfamily N-acetyltransferase